MSKQLWHPTSIKRLIRNDIDSSTSPVVVLTDQGKGYFKALGNPEGPQVLAREFVGTALAELLGIPTFEYRIIHYTGIPEIRLFRGEQAKSGPGFITKEEAGEVWDGSEKSLKHLTNPEAIACLVGLDTWIRNTDRYSLRRDGTAHVHYDNVFLSRDAAHKLVLNAFDFTHATFCEARTASKAIVDDAIYGLFPEFQRYLKYEVAEQVCKTLASISQKQIRAILRQVPDEWDIESIRDVWTDFLTKRAFFLSKHFTSLIGLAPPVPKQLSFPFIEEV